MMLFKRIFTIAVFAILASGTMYLVVWEKIVQPIFFPHTVTLNENDVLVHGYISDSASIEADIAYIKLKLKGISSIEVYLDSPGGNASQALGIIDGWALFGFNKVVTKLPSHASCLSACVPIFAAGNERYADRQSVFMFHGLMPKYQIFQKLHVPFSGETDYYAHLKFADVAFFNALHQFGVFESADSQFYFVSEDVPDYAETFLKLQSISAHSGGVTDSSLRELRSSQRSPFEPLNHGQMPTQAAPGDAPRPKLGDAQGGGRAKSTDQAAHTSGGRGGSFVVLRHLLQRTVGQKRSSASPSAKMMSSDLNVQGRSEMSETVPLSGARCPEFANREIAFRAACRHVRHRLIFSC